MFIKNIEAEKRLHEFMKSAGIDQPDILFDGNYLVFGGAVRDAISGEEKCNDIDILTYEEFITCFQLPEFKLFELIKNYEDGNVDGESYNSDISGIKMLKHGYDTPIDLLHSKIKPETFFDFLACIQEVDIDVSAIAYNPMFGFIECLPGVYQKCLKKHFELRVYADGYHKIKTYERAEALEKKGWKNRISF